MKYLLLHTLDDSLVDQAGLDARATALDAWSEEMVARGVLLDGARLRGVDDATSVRAPGGEVTVTDGPFAETKEHVAGYDVVDCPDLDSAVAVATAHPTVDVGSIEVRAFGAGMPDPEVPDPEPGRFRYLMLVCADMRRAMAAAREQASAPEPASPSQSEPPTEDELDDIDVWIQNLAHRRIYGWELEFPDRAVTVRRREGSVMTTDGPFAETKEQIAGYDLLDCADLDEALAAAAAHPVAGGGVIEVRPLWI